MPIYSFMCKNCNHKFTELVNVTDNDNELKCPKCNSKNLEKLLTTFSVGNSEGTSFDSSSTSTCSTGTCSTGTCPTCF